MASSARVLVIGATGILRPAVETLLGRGAAVVAIARDTTALAALAPSSSADITVRAVDAHDAPALAQSLDNLALTAAIAYDPAVSDAGWTVVARVVDGPVVRVLTSAAVDPAGPGLAPPRYPFSRLVLGWTADGRWHTPAEVSAAAIETLDAAEADTPEWTFELDGAVLGRVRPWSQRPA